MDGSVLPWGWSQPCSSRGKRFALAHAPNSLLHGQRPLSPSRKLETLRKKDLEPGIVDTRSYASV
jgi:hypothetical protein